MRIIRNNFLKLALGVAMAGMFCNPNAQANHDRPKIGKYQAQRLVTLLYQAVLLRNPEPAGLYGWSNKIHHGGYPALIQTAQDIANSAEFFQHIFPDFPPRVIVRQLYWVLLERELDSGAKGWIRLMAQGRSAEVLRGIVGSAEFYDLHFRWD